MPEPFWWSASWCRDSRSFLPFLQSRCFTLFPLFLWIFIKLPQEWWIHIAKLDMTDFIKENPQSTQGEIGVLLVASGQIPSDLLHFLYGVLVALSWPAVYVYTNARNGRNEAGFYALAGFFVFGLALRAITTGAVVR